MLTQTPQKRTYALAGRNREVLAVFTFLTATQFTSGDSDHTHVTLFEREKLRWRHALPQRPTGIPSNGHARRKTLDEEIWVAENGVSFDSCVLIGVGTRGKKRGFLKGGGAAGAPVHMGLGYAIGAEYSEDEGLPDH